VIGFMGGRIHAGNLAHGEARLARDLDQQYSGAVEAMTFANHDEQHALRTLLALLDTSHDGHLSEAEKSAARVVVFGHSWGGSETIHFARELNRRGIPVLLTVQVDSVQKSGENDATIPPNVREAINFYQTEGLLHGRSSIQAVDPLRTKILGSYESSYKRNPISCTGYSWYARTFMKPHIEIENDRALWSRIEALIVARSCAGNLPGMAAECAER
jgi:pimeloyl-ACP methyl ester carboxylesterase